MMKTVVAVLDTMWGERNARAPRYFQINPNNRSGKMLYRLVGPYRRLWVTNSCREMVNNARRHGKPDPGWLAENLRRLKPDLVLVCGKVAQKTFREACPMKWDGCDDISIPHPAARNWSQKQIKRIARKIEKKLGDPVEEVCMVCWEPADPDHPHKKCNRLWRVL
jgi:hypothetical protein